MWDPSDLLSLWDFFCGILYGIPCGIHLGSMRLALVHVTRDTHGLVARGWLECLVFSLVFQFGMFINNNIMLGSSTIPTTPLLIGWILLAILSVVVELMADIAEISHSPLPLLLC